MKDISNLDPSYGLTAAMIEDRKYNNKVNYDTNVKSKSIGAIVKSNLFTLFNLINFFLAFLLVLVGSYENTVFILVAIANLIIGTVNEVRAKLIIDKLSLLVATKAKVVREGEEVEIAIFDIVLDDIILYQTGNQIPVDSLILSGEIEVNQSFITGEEKPIYKKPGDTILSGSFIISGLCTCQVEAVGEDNYTSKISKDAKYLKDNNSEILESLRKIIRFVTFIIIPFGLFTFFKQINFDHIDMSEAVIATVAALDGMIPNGLILLTSAVMAVGVIRLQRFRVLVQELYSIETLARVDIVCIDKTGTLTEGKMEVYDTAPYGQHTLNEMEEIITNMCAYTKDKNATSIALGNKFTGSHSWESTTVVPFSSKRKYSGVSFKDRGTFLIGAPEFLVKSQYDSIGKTVEKYEEKHRVLALMHSNLQLGIDEVPEDLEIIGFILLQDKIRKEAKNTLAYFKEENVRVNIISGDSVTTITNIAERLGIDDISAIDMREVSDDDIEDIVTEYNVYGRVSPEQKKTIILKLQSMGHTVAMIGDGVNDVLALKEADCSVAMASGSDAARNVSQLILLNSNFDALPKVLLEGRRSINNIEKTSALFLSKTMYSIAIILFFLFLPFSYPFTPLQLTLVSTLTIGIPAFFLGLGSNHDLVKKGFLRNVFKNILAPGITMIVYVAIVAGLAFINNWDSEMLSILCILTAASIGFMLLISVSKPLDLPRIVLISLMLFAFLITLILFPGILSISEFNPELCTYYAYSFIGTFLLFEMINRMVKYKKKNA